MIVRKQIMNSIVTLKGKQLIITCKDDATKNNIEKLLNILEENIANGNWGENDYYTFLKQLSTMEVDVFNKCLDEMILLLNQPLTDVEKRLKEVDNKLELNIFKDERTLEKIKPTLNDNKKQASNHRLIMKPHEFSTSDIAQFFKTLHSYIDKHGYNIYNLYKNKIDECKSIDDKTQELKLLIDLLIDENQLIVEQLTKPYFEWINSLPEDDSIYIYLSNQINHLITINEKSLKVKLFQYERQREPIKYSKQQQDYYEQLMEKKKKRLGKVHII